MQNIMNKNFEMNKKAEMANSVKITFIIIGAILVLALAGYMIYSQGHGQTLTMQGISSVKAMPDKVTIYFSAESTGITASDAKDENAVIVDKILADLYAGNYDRGSISTENFNVYPEYNYPANSIKDYKCTQNIKVVLNTSAMDKAGNVIDIGVNAGALVNYINFELSQDAQNKYKADALKLATLDAKTKAEATASGLGKQVGSVVSVSESSFNYYPWPMYTNARSDVSGAVEAKVAIATNINPGSQDVSASVTVIFKLA